MLRSQITLSCVMQLAFWLVPTGITVPIDPWHLAEASTSRTLQPPGLPETATLDPIGRSTSVLHYPIGSKRARDDDFTIVPEALGSSWELFSNHLARLETSTSAPIHCFLQGTQSNLDDHAMDFERLHTSGQISKNFDEASYLHAPWPQQVTPELSVTVGKDATLFHKGAHQGDLREPKKPRQYDASAVKTFEDFWGEYSDELWPNCENVLTHEDLPERRGSSTDIEVMPNRGSSLMSHLAEPALSDWQTCMFQSPAGMCHEDSGLLTRLAGHEEPSEWKSYLALSPAMPDEDHELTTRQADIKETSDWNGNSQAPFQPSSINNPHATTITQHLKKTDIIANHESASNSPTQQQFNQAFQYEPSSCWLSDVGDNNEAFSYSGYTQLAPELHPTIQIDESSKDHDTLLEQLLLDTDDKSKPTHAQQFQTQCYPQLTAVSAADESPLQTIEAPKIVFGGRRLTTFKLSSRIISRFLSIQMGKFENDLRSFCNRFGELARELKIREIPGCRVAQAFVPATQSRAATSLICLTPRQRSRKSVFEIPSEIRKELSPLFKCVMFYLNIFLNLVGDTHQSFGDAEGDIVTWLQDQVLKPQNSLPLMGEVKKNIEYLELKDFGPIQRLLISSLCSVDQDKNHHQIAANIIGIYYKTFHPTAWSYFENDQHFWRAMDEAKITGNGGRASSIRQPKLYSDIFETKIGNFEVFYLGDLLKSITLPDYGLNVARTRYNKAKKHFIKPNTKDSIKEIHEMIIHDMQVVYQMCKVGRDQVKLVFKGISVGLTAINESYCKSKDVYVLRMLKYESDVVIKPLDVKRRLQVLLHRMTDYFTSFLGYADYQGQHARFMSYMNFFTWLKDELFEPKVRPEKIQPTLPVFGVMKNEAQCLDKGAFEPFQRFIISYLSASEPRDFSDQIFSTIIGYWYKNEYRKDWDVYFHTDEEFWVFMANALQTFSTPKTHYDERCEGVRSQNRGLSTLTREILTN